MTLGGTEPLVDPQAGLAYDLETYDPSQNAIPPLNTLTSPGLAAQMIEQYWQALTRDVSFSDYDTDPTVAAACPELGGLSSYLGRESRRQRHAAMPVSRLHGRRRDRTLHLAVLHPAVPSRCDPVSRLPDDASRYFATNLALWLNVQNGAPSPIQSENPDPQLRYLRSARDLAEYVHNDVLYQEYLCAALMLMKMKAPLNSGDPYPPTLKSESGFITFGFPMVEVLIAEVIARALKNAWMQKWFVHRMARPEETAGLVHFTITGQKNYPLDSSVLNSKAAAAVFARNGNYFIPMSYPEGCPLHPSYPSGHATASGAAVTVLKWFFDEDFVIPNPLTTTFDGLATVPYTGGDAGQMTVGGTQQAGVERRIRPMRCGNPLAPGHPAGNAAGRSGRDKSVKGPGTPVQRELHRLHVHRLQRKYRSRFEYRSYSSATWSPSAIIPAFAIVA